MNAQTGTTTLTLALRQSMPVRGTDFTLSFDDVVEDSRCPKGVTCIWEGDAAIKIRLTSPKAAPADYVLHTSSRFEQKAEHGGLKVTLMAVMPYPVADAPIRRQDYRVTLSIERN
jgi:hypothetical protein